MGRNCLVQVLVFIWCNSNFFPVGKISQSCIIVLKTQLWFFGLIKSRFSEPELFLIYTRVSKTTPAMVINFTDNDDIQRYSHPSNHDSRFYHGFGGKGQAFWKHAGRRGVKLKRKKKTQSKQKIDIGAQNIRDCGDNYNSFWPLTGQNVFL